jgi:hypothetical protein
LKLRQTLNAPADDFTIPDFTTPSFHDFGDPGIKGAFSATLPARAVFFRWAAMPGRLILPPSHART